MAKEQDKATIKEQVVKASARNLRIAPRKLRLMTNLVQRMPVADALVQLQFQNKKAAPLVDKLLRSAIANAVNNFSLKAEDLYVESLTCDQGPVMMRYMPRARGSASPIRRKTSHLNVVLISRPSKKAKARGLKILGIKKSEAEKKSLEKSSPETSQLDSSKPTAPLTPKSSEKIKGNTVQQKRRLFNRRTGE